MKTTDQIIHEAIGLCWHEWEQVHCCGGSKCKRCGHYWPVPPDERTKSIIQDVDYTLWKQYGPMLEWAMKQKWWDEFKIWHATQAFCSYRDKEFIHQSILNPLKGSTAIAEFWKERKL